MRIASLPDAYGQEKLIFEPSCQFLEGVLTRNSRVKFFLLLWVPTSPLIIHRMTHYTVDSSVNNYLRPRVFGSVSVSTKGTPKLPSWQEGARDVTVLAVPLPVWTCARKRSRPCPDRPGFPPSARTGKFGARGSRWHHADVDCQRVSVLCFLVCAKIKMDLTEVILNGYCWNLLGYISIYKGSFLHSCASFEISCQYSFMVLLCKSTVSLSRRISRDIMHLVKRHFCEAFHIFRL